MKRLALFVGILIACVLLPIILWFSQNGKELEVVIIDKTVLDDSYREHSGLVWALNHLKYRKEDGTTYNMEEDYYGIKPNKESEKYELIPPPDSYDKTDLIYIADTYGVYDQDSSLNSNGMNGAHSELLYGGMEEEEWQQIASRLQQEKPATLIVEFNSLSFPTNEKVRQSMEQFLGVERSGWIGRYFESLDPDLNGDIPKWVTDEHPDIFKYEESGFLLVNEQKNEVVLLKSEQHLKGKGISIQFTKEGQEKFNMDKSAAYYNWFDIVSASGPTETLAEYNWDLTDKGKELLAEYSIPQQFASITENKRNSATSYYFAGDYNDIASAPYFYQMEGLDVLYRLFKKFSDESFYWSLYIPVMENILNETRERTADNIPNDEAGVELMYNSRINKDKFEVLIDGEWSTLPVKGVNMGMAKPGAFPGEAAITEEEYSRWLESIADMGANTIRIYTVHPPEFYHAFKQYNETHEDKLYLFHGVWIDEEGLVSKLDAFDDAIVQDFQTEMKKIVDIVHGNATVPSHPGHASGVYSEDISEYVIGWIIGIEWFPEMVVNTNEVNKDIDEYNGEYIYTQNASPFEHWLAVQLEELVSYEKENYNWIRPVSFTNWVTTDLLEHPAEPSPEEDMVSVNPNHIHVKGELDKTKQFASYHVYPYYPDFLNYEENYLNYRDHRGKRNNYAAYLEELHAAHDLPILIAEFGVPASRGMTHANPNGWNQGFLSEKEQGEIVVNLYEDIVQEGLLGGLIFTWQDEWFKRTWNTMDYDNPDRRPYWSNAQTNEQQFGLLSFDRLKIKVDGETTDWSDSTTLYNKETGNLTSLQADYDERYLYLKLDLNKTGNHHWKILLDTLPDQGNLTSESLENKQFSNGIDFIIDIDQNGESRVRVDSYYDLFTYQYRYQLKLIDPISDPLKQNSGKFIPVNYALSNELLIPSTNKVIPFNYYETGKLMEGNGNPELADYNSLTDYTVNNDGGVIEIRIPWLLLNFRDPSQREVTGDLYQDGLNSSVKVDQIHIGAIEQNEEGKIVDSLPSLKNNRLDPLNAYTWETWNEPQYEERLKQSYYIIKEAFKKE
ncbi:hypothetical protein SAMN04487944_104131 [Gracilibacillus ureilyticus]|uniref:Family 2 glycosyl transferase n=1 Tax=Gracilibacillus ureilyticus TaxID=531814 RepID=A0A1H9P6Z8_9BACI|nr:hypothetical protein [Gracilibacillus ureilyticus]SER44094.1 hypothetical protein SAMN04487944_104131 [Gracilibacillus ureilyticus]